LIHANHMHDARQWNVMTTEVLVSRVVGEQIKNELAGWDTVAYTGGK